MHCYHCKFQMNLILLPSISNPSCYAIRLQSFWWENVSVHVSQTVDSLYDYFFFPSRLFAYACITKSHVFSVYLPPIKMYMSHKNVHVKNQLILYIHYSLVCNSYARHYVCDAHAAVSPSSAILKAHCS